MSDSSATGAGCCQCVGCTAAPGQPAPRAARMMNTDESRNRIRSLSGARYVDPLWMIVRNRQLHGCDVPCSTSAYAARTAVSAPCRVRSGRLRKILRVGARTARRWCASPAMYATAPASCSTSRRASAKSSGISRNARSRGACAGNASRCGLDGHSEGHRGVRRPPARPAVRRARARWLHCAEICGRAGVL